MIEECNQEWVRAELLRWEEGLSRRVDEVMLRITELEARLASLETYVSEQAARA